MKSIIVDANVILRYLLKDNEKFFMESKNLFDKALKNDVEIIIKQVILAKVVYVLEKVYQIEKNEISETLTELLSLKGIKADDKQTLIKSLQIYKEKKHGFCRCYLMCFIR
ncbi:MAG: PIN domain-containing protein [Sulfurihydrogenibium azorense]